MEQIILNIKKKEKIPFLKELLKHMDFVEVVEPSKKEKKKKILSDLEEAVEYVNKLKKGEVKAKSLNQFLDEL
jgi:hypothetical protein